MSAALIAALFFTAVLLLITTYFVMGSVPLLILEHDVPMDARFVRGFFNSYYIAFIGGAAGAAASYVLAGRLAFAAGAAALALLAAVLRRTVLAAMQRLGAQIPVDGRTAVRAFRRVHATAIVINLLQLAPLVWSLIVVSRG